MQGILIASHGKLADGLLDSLKVFFGQELTQIDSVCYLAGESLNEFTDSLKKKTEELDTGDGVLILVDLFGGTPAHAVTALISNKVKVISGFNLPMVMEILSVRENSILEPSDVIEYGKAGLMEWNPNDFEPADDEEFF